MITTMPVPRSCLLFLAGLLCLLTAGPALGAGDDRVFWVLDGEALGGYSKVEGTGGTGTSLNDWLVSPTVKLGDDLRWINVYNGSFNRAAQVVAQEEGGRRSQTTQNHSLSTALKWNVSKSWSLRPLFFADWVFVNETEDESFGDGLYDYRDIGAGLESSWITLETEGRRDEVRLGFRYLDREYPNYHSLLSLVLANPVETDEKDLEGYKINLSKESRAKSDRSWGLEGIFFYKDYTDKKTIDRNGILQPGSTREDLVGYLNGYVSGPLRPAWSWRLDGQLAANSSNLDYYDTHSTLTPADDDFIKDYFDWVSVTVTPSLNYTRTLSEGKELVCTVNYSFNALLYPDRRVQNTAGLYRSDKQRDYTHTVSGKIKVPLTKNVSWVGFASYTIADSNQDFEQFYLYSYDRWVAVTGLAVQF